MDSNIENHKNTIKSNIIDSFEKGRISEALTYGNSKIEITKTGKELKQAISSKINQCKIEEVQLMTKMKECLKLCNSLPTSNFGEYMFKGCKDKLAFIPMRFSYEEVNSSASNSEVSVTSKNSVSNDNCNKYNSAARAYINKCVDTCFLQTIFNGIVDSKKYQLSVAQGVLLGL